MFKQKNLYFSSIIGFIFFIFIVGLDIVNFNNIYWLIDCPIICDAQQHILGWLFFKETNLLQFPLLKNTSFGLYTGSSLIYTDSLPILAIFFKFFNSILDFQFQYFGLWVLISFILPLRVGYFFNQSMLLLRVTPVSDRSSHNRMLPLIS